MKVSVYQDFGGRIRFYQHPRKCNYTYLGTLDLDIQPIKKTAVKEGYVCTVYCADTYEGYLAVSASLPTNATNIKLTYEVKE